MRALSRSLRGKAAPLPAAFVAVEQIAPEKHLAMQAAVQRYLENAISRTINVLAEINFDSCRSIYEKVFVWDLKTARLSTDDVTGSILMADSTREKLCCSMDRKAD